MLAYLKVKIKSLAAESRIIRLEERKYKANRIVGRTDEFEGFVRHRKQTENVKAVRHGLYHHRVDEVRFEARHALLAYGFLRGVPYAKIEKETNKPRKRVALKRLRANIETFVTGKVFDEKLGDNIEKWLKGEFLIEPRKPSGTIQPKN